MDLTERLKRSTSQNTFDVTANIKSVYCILLKST